jgi:hypothetical protein
VGELMGMAADAAREAVRPNLIAEANAAHRGWAVVRIPEEHGTDESKGVTLRRGLAFDAAVAYKADYFDAIRGEGGTIEDDYRFFHPNGDTGGVVICADDVAPEIGACVAPYGTNAQGEPDQVPFNPAPLTAASIVSADSIINRLLELPGEIERDEMRLADAEWQVAEEKLSLQRTEDDLLTTSAALIDGKNEAVRAAQVRAHTYSQRLRLQDLETNLRAAKVMFHKSANEFSALKAVARLLERGE